MNVTSKHISTGLNVSKVDVNYFKNKHCYSFQPKIKRSFIILATTHDSSVQQHTFQLTTITNYSDANLRYISR